MSLAKQTVARAQNTEAKREEQQRFLLRVTEATMEGAPHLWDDMRQYIEREVNELVETLPAAKFLRSDRFGDDNITVQTTVVPMVKLVVLRRGLYLTTTYLEFAHGLSKGIEKNLDRFRFTVDGDLHPCFTDERGRLHPHQVADRLLTPVFDFVSEHPPMSNCFW